MKFQIYRGHGTQPWRWRLLAKNHKIVADGGEGYATKRGCRLAVNRIVDQLTMGAYFGHGVEVEYLVGARA